MAEGFFPQLGFFPTNSGIFSQVRDFFPHDSGIFSQIQDFFPWLWDFFPLEDFFPWTSLRVFTLWSSLDDPFMTPWLSVTDLNYSRQPSLSEIPAQHLTVQVAGWLTHLSQVPYLSACVWTRLDCCTHSQFRVRPTHSRDQFTCSSKVSLFLPSSLHVPLMILPSYHLTLVSLVFDSRNIKLVLHWRHKEEQIRP